MAYIVGKSAFNPFSFQELLTPLQMYNQAYKEQEAIYDALSEKAANVAQMANQQGDPQAYERYQSYARDLQAQADALATQGLSPSIRSNLKTLKTRYGQEVAPIETAYTRRAQLADEQRKARLSDDTLIFSQDFSTTSLDDLIANPSMGYESISGRNIAKRTGEMASQAAEAMLSNPKYTSVFKGQYVQQMIQQGYTLDQVLAAAQNDPNAPAALKGIKEAIKKEVGYDKWDTLNQAQIEAYINQGLENAVGKPKIDVMRDYTISQEMEKERLQLEKDRLAFAQEQEKGVAQPDGSFIKPLGGGKYIHYSAKGEILADSNLPETPENKEAREQANKLSTSLAKVTRVSDMRGLGFEPIGVVSKTQGAWYRGKQGQDIGETPMTDDRNVFAGFTNTNLKTTWGNISYKPNDPSAETHVVTDIESIPGFKEYITSEDPANPRIEKAFGQILETLSENGITPEQFFSTDDYQIVKIKGKHSRALSEEPWDYIIYKKS